MSDQKNQNWRIQTDFMILETEYHDNEYRKKNSGHKCNKEWYDSGNGRWFCKHLLDARKRNKKLRKKWLDNLKESPLLVKSKFLLEKSKSINI